MKTCSFLAVQDHFKAPSYDPMKIDRAMRPWSKGDHMVYGHPTKIHTAHLMLLTPSASKTRSRPLTT